MRTPEPEVRQGAVSGMRTFDASQYPARTAVVRGRGYLTLFMPRVTDARPERFNHGGP